MLSAITSPDSPKSFTIRTKNQQQKEVLIRIMQIIKRMRAHPCIFSPDTCLIIQSVGEDRTHDSGWDFNIAVCVSLNTL
mgnify:CR=1 FL=1